MLTSHQIYLWKKDEALDLLRYNSPKDMTQPDVRQLI
jgi:hypothetical protein